MATASRSNTPSGAGPDQAKNKKLQKCSTDPKGRMNQPRGSSKHNTAPGKAKKLKKGVTDFGDDVEF